MVYLTFVSTQALVKSGEGGFSCWNLS